MSLLGLKASVTLAVLEPLGLSAPVYTHRLRVTCTASPKKFNKQTLHRRQTEEGRRSVDLTWAELPQFDFQFGN